MVMVPVGDVKARAMDFEKLFRNCSGNFDSHSLPIPILLPPDENTALEPPLYCGSSDTVVCTLRCLLRLETVPGVRLPLGVFQILGQLTYLMLVDKILEHREPATKKTIYLDLLNPRPRPRYASVLADRARDSHTTSLVVRHYLVPFCLLQITGTVSEQFFSDRKLRLDANS